MSEMTNVGTVPTFDKADRLGKALQHGNVSVQEMAKHLGVTRNTVGNYLNRRSDIGRGNLIAWALATGVPLEWLEHGTSTAPDPGPGNDPEGELQKLTERKRDGRHGSGATCGYPVSALAA